MMKSLLVVADFHWLPSPQVVGRLTFDSVRGADVYGFEFDRDWLKDHGDLFLSGDLMNYPGIQYAPQGRDIFGMLADALPDRWGRTLLNRREQIQAREQNRSPRRIDSRLAPL